MLRFSPLNMILDVNLSSVAIQLLSHVQLFVTPWTTACQASLSFTISWRLLKLMSTEHQVAKVLELQHQSFQSSKSSGDFAELGL